LTRRSIIAVRPLLHCLALVLTLGRVADSEARSWPLPPPGDDIIGEIAWTNARSEDTLADLARTFRQGYEALRAANPTVDAWLPKEGTPVLLPNRHILPPGPREGIVINVAEMRLYYFPPVGKSQSGVVQTYPVAIGRGDWRTPLVQTRVTGKVTDPVWYPPESIRMEHAADGRPLPRVVPAGPDNPLGKYALRLSIPSYLIHGTNKQYGIGMQVTHGCIRMYPEDIEALYKQVPVNTPVRIISQRFKAGWHQGVLHIEVHAPLEQYSAEQRADRQPLLDAIAAATRERPDYPVDWLAVDVAVAEASGLPVAVGPVWQPAVIAEEAVVTGGAALP
jgi:L,D-transpeptidase ErfK/SrfK